VSSASGSASGSVRTGSEVVSVVMRSKGSHT
jgi:hypothetical protein